MLAWTDTLFHCKHACHHTSCNTHTHTRMHSVCVLQPSSVCLSCARALIMRTLLSPLPLIHASTPTQLSACPLTPHTHTQVLSPHARVSASAPTASKHGPAVLAALHRSARPAAVVWVVHQGRKRRIEYACLSACLSTRAHTAIVCARTPEAVHHRLRHTQAHTCTHARVDFISSSVSLRRSH